jgi:hypothetical protein
MGVLRRTGRGQPRASRALTLLILLGSQGPRGHETGLGGVCTQSGPPSAAALLESGEKVCAVSVILDSVLQDAVRARRLPARCSDASVAAAAHDGKVSTVLDSVLYDLSLPRTDSSALAVGTLGRQPLGRGAPNGVMLESGHTYAEMASTSCPESARIRKVARLPGPGGRAFRTLDALLRDLAQRQATNGDRRTPEPAGHCTEHDRQGAEATREDKSGVHVLWREGADAAASAHGAQCLVKGGREQDEGVDAPGHRKKRSRMEEGAVKAERDGGIAGAAGGGGQRAVGERQCRDREKAVRLDDLEESMDIVHEQVLHPPHAKH